MSKHLAYLYLLIVRTNGIYNHSKPIELVDLDFCPFTNFCHRNATDALKEDMVPCCTPCSCSDNCWEQGYCCPDKDIIVHRVPDLECNITGLWRDYDASVDLACQTYVSSIVTYIQKSLMYKNIYCYYCNGLNGQQFAKSCPDLSDGRNGILSKSFSALIDFTERQPSGVASLCNQHEIFDIFIVSMISRARIQKILTEGVRLFCSC